MPEVYTCSCGAQTWVILPGEVECAKCHQRYRLPDNKLCAPSEFNRQLTQLRIDE